MKEKDRVADEELIAEGFPPDQDFENDVVHRNATVTQECLQRSKTLDHSCQVGLRKEEERKLHEKKLNKLLLENEKKKKTLKDNSTCEEKTLENMKDSDVKEPHTLNKARLSDFATPLKAELTGFFLRRATKKKSELPRNKGTLLECSYGAVNLIQVACNCRSDKVTLLETTVEAEQESDDTMNLPTDHPIIGMPRLPTDLNDSIFLITARTIELSYQVFDDEELHSRLRKNIINSELEALNKLLKKHYPAFKS